MRDVVPVVASSYFARRTAASRISAANRAPSPWALRPEWVDGRQLPRTAVLLVHFGDPTRPTDIQLGGSLHGKVSRRLSSTSSSLGVVSSFPFNGSLTDASAALGFTTRVLRRLMSCPHGGCPHASRAHRHSSGSPQGVLKSISHSGTKRRASAGAGWLAAQTARNDPGIVSRSASGCVGRRRA
jgi:hypothetical protein